MRHLLLAVMMATALAGCSDPGTGSAGTSDDTFEGFDEPKVTATTGIIRGVVFDAAIVPIEGAKVTLQGTGTQRVTNANGAFVMGDLQPGHYFLKVSALGYSTVQASAQVEPGVDQPPVVKVQLAADPAGMPWYDDHYFAGFIQCGTNVVAICGGVRDFTGLGEDTYSSLYETGANITHLQSEMVWKSTQEFGDSFSVAHRYATQEQYDGGFYEDDLRSGSGPSPLLVITNVERYNENNVGEGYEFLISIFAGGSNVVPLVGVAIEQDYEMFIHEFHGYVPPEGWRFSETSEVPPPQ